jgi:mitogen-activated protein kinase kinase kinase 7
LSSRVPPSTLSLKGDVYALAMTLWEIQSRKEPFANLSTFRVGRLVMGGERPAIMAGCDPTFADLVRTGWHQQPEKRPSAQEIVRTLEALQQQGEDV